MFGAYVDPAQMPFPTAFSLVFFYPMLTCAKTLVSFYRLPGQLVQKIRHHFMAVRSQNRLWMELDSLYIIRFMTHTHDRPVFQFTGDFQTIRQGLPLNNQ